MEVNNRERIEGKDFVKGGVYEVFKKDPKNSLSKGIYFYPYSVPNNAIYENTRRFFSKVFGPTIILKRIYRSSQEKYNKNTYNKFNKKNIYGKKPVSIENIDLVEIDLGSADLTGAILNNVNFTEANLTDANFTSVNFNDSILTGAFLYNIILTGADLTNVDLTRIKSGGVKGQPKLPLGYLLIGGYIIGPNVDLTGADLNRLDLTRIKSGGVKGNPKLPSGYKIINGYIIGPNVDLNGANLNRLDLTEVNLTGIKSGEITGNPQLPSGYKIINGYIIGPNVDLTGADLNRLDLSEVNLTGIKSGEITGNPQLPSGYKIINGYIIGPNVDLTGADLNRLDLTDVNLTGIIAVEIKGIPKLPNNYKLINSCIFGPNVSIARTVFKDVIDLSYINLSGSDLSHIRLCKGSLLSYSNLKNCNLESSTLLNVDFTRANLTHANLSSAKLSNDSLSEKQKEQIIGEPIYEDYSESRNNISISKRITDGKNKINKEQMERAKMAVKNEKNEYAIKEEYNKRMERKRKQNKEDKKESIKKLFLEKEKQEPTQNEINRIYKNTKQKNTGKENKNFSDLLDYLLDKKNQVKIAKRFVIVGETGFNAGGLTRSIFEKSYKIFLERYFKEYKFDEIYYVILKDLNEELFEEFKKACEFMILLAKRGRVKILIQINPQLLNVLSIKRNNRTYFINNSYKLFFTHNAICNFDHYDKVKKFYSVFWEINPNVFTNHIDYSWDNFKERLRFQLPNSHLDSFNSFDEFMTEENAQINTYPFIELILDYLKYSDEYRMRFTTLTCGSYTYTGHIYIKIFNNHSILDPFNAHTCSQTIDVNIKLSDRYPVVYHELFCERSNQVVNNQNESGNGNGRVNNPNESGRVNGRVNGRGSNQNERVNPIVNNVIESNESRRGSNPNERVNPIVNNVIESNESRRGSNPNEHGRVNNKSCRYLIEKLDKLILMAISQGFNIA
jgi:uncharacterized protein YjbI with pentapeptide repeats